MYIHLIIYIYIHMLTDGPTDPHAPSLEMQTNPSMHFANGWLLRLASYCCLALCTARGGGLRSDAFGWDLGGLTFESA